jgi:hypothetical protein
VLTCPRRSRATSLTANESRYCTVAHVPKATIQAVFGVYPLSVFLERCGDPPALLDGGQTLVVMAVVAIVATAPLAALLLERLAARCLAPEGRLASSGLRLGPHARLPAPHDSLVRTAATTSR